MNSIRADYSKIIEVYQAYYLARWQVGIIGFSYSPSEDLVAWRSHGVYEADLDSDMIDILLSTLYLVFLQMQCADSFGRKNDPEIASSD